MKTVSNYKHVPLCIHYNCYNHTYITQSIIWSDSPPETPRIYVHIHTQCIWRIVQTRDSPLLPIPNDVARLRKSVISTMRSFTVAPVAFPACTQQAFLLETVFDVLAKINTDAPVNLGHASVLSATLRHSRRLAPDYRCKRRLFGHSTCLLWSNTFRLLPITNN